MVRVYYTVASCDTVTRVTKKKKKKKTKLVFFFFFFFSPGVGKIEPGVGVGVISEK